MPTATANVKFDLTFVATPEAVREIETLSFDYLAKDLQRYLVPMMRSVAPRRSGQLRKGIKVHRTRSGIVITAAFYWRFQTGLPEKWYSIFQNNIQLLLQRSFNRAVAEVLPAYTPGR